jgi:hypothetical protein
MNKLAPPALPGLRTLLLLAALAALTVPAAAAAAPTLTVSPEPVKVPTTTVGMNSEMLTVELRNDDEEAVKFESISLVGADADQFGFHGSSCGTLYAGETCQAWFQFSPRSVGIKVAALSVGTVERKPQEIALQAEAAPVKLSWNPESHDFGMRRVYDGSEDYLQLENSGAAPTQLGSLEIGGADTNNFWVSDSSCWSFPGNVIEPGQTCWVRVFFQPGDARAFEAELIASVGADEFSASLRGEGGRAELVAPANPFGLGSAGVGTAGELRTITLTNQGNLAGGYFIAIVAGGDSGSFELVQETCSGVEPVEPGASCSVQVRFKPLSAGPKSARLAFFGEDDGGTMIFLEGEGVAARVGLSAPGLHLGSQESGTRGAAQTLLVANDGSQPATVDWVALAGADSDQFLLAGEQCTGAALAPGASCAVRIRFAPDSPGQKSARLRVGGGFGTLSATLAGTGTPAAPAPASVQAIPAPAPSPLAAPHPVRASKRFARNSTIHAPKRLRARRSALGQRLVEREGQRRTRR